MAETRTDLNVADIEAYLKKNPDVFLLHPHLMDVIDLHQPPVGTISLAQRQYQRAREKNHQLSEQLRAVIDNAHDNVTLGKRIHALCLELLDSSDLNNLVDILSKELKQEFSADDVAIRLFYRKQPFELPVMVQNVEQCHADDAALKCFDTLLDKKIAVCGRLTNAQKTFLFADKASEIHSVACLPLGHQPCAGLLAIGSHDPNRFHADMGTDFLSFLGDIFMRALRQHYYARS